MAIVVADTSAWVFYLNGGSSDSLELALAAGSLALPMLVKLELLSVPVNKKQRKSLESLFQRLPVLGLAPEHIGYAAKMKADLETKGIRISARDAHVLQCVLDCDALFLTKDPFWAGLEKACGLRILL